MNHYAAWKNLLILLLIGTAVIYALPNIYGKGSVVQVSGARNEVDELTKLEVGANLDEAGIAYQSIQLKSDHLLVRFGDTEDQLKAQAILAKVLGNRYSVALNLVANTPDWLQNMGGEPMFLGLDLRGGVHFLLEVDMVAAVAKAEDRYISDLRTLLRDNKLHYKTVSTYPEGGVLLRLRESTDDDKVKSLIKREYPNLILSELEASEPQLLVNISDQEINDTRRFAMQQNMTILRNRVNEFGVAEPVIQQQGQERIVVQLPGVQNTAKAKDLLGATATLEFRLQNTEHDVAGALDGRVPAGTKLYYDRSGQPMLLNKQVMLTGDRIIDAASGIDTETGSPSVFIVLDGKGASIFSRATRKAVNRPLATVFIENKVDWVEVDGELVKQKKTVSEVINVATIESQLGKQFRVTGLDSLEEARNLALLLRSGALAAPIEIVEERTVGPSLGQDHIQQGTISVVVGFMLVLLLMAIYYKMFGIVADIALALNLVFIVAMLSMLQATLTLPGIAGILLTIGMAVDANVLIFERIREEIRNGNSPQASIHVGYQKAFSTIADANITTLIAALVLFNFGTGPIKGFAVTLSLGIISSMFTAIFVSRALINLLYGGRRVTHLSV